MAIPITVPRLDWSMNESFFVGWYKKEGERVKPGDAIYRLENDRTSQEIDSPGEGILHILPGGPKQGDGVTAGTLLGYLFIDPEKEAEVARPEGFC